MVAPAASELFVNWLTGKPIALFDALGSVFNASGASHSIGLVPDPGSTPGSARALFEDATWKNVTAAIAVFGASGPSHSTGAVPDPGAVAGTSKFLREDATWQTISVPTLLPTVPGGRLSVTSNVPVLLSSTSGASTIYYTPYHHTTVPIYDGSTFVLSDVGGELSQATSDTTKSPAAVTTNSNYDIFVWNDGGTYRATRGPAWSSNTNRGSGAGTSELSLLKGILVNTNAITNGPGALKGTYVGSIRSNGTSTVDFAITGSGSGGSACSLGVYNYYNRVEYVSQVADSGVSYTYNVNTIRQARASAGNQISVMLGIVEDGIGISYQVSLATGASAANNTESIGVGYDTTTAYSNSMQAKLQNNTAANWHMKGPHAWFFPAGLLSIGYHTFSANENAEVGANSYNVDSDNILYLEVLI